MVTLARKQPAEAAKKIAKNKEGKRNLKIKPVKDRPNKEEATRVEGEPEVVNGAKCQRTDFCCCSPHCCCCCWPQTGQTGQWRQCARSLGVNEQLLQLTRSCCTVQYI